MSKGGLIVVTGATGQQGGATARRLLAEGWPVRALTRDPLHPAATALRRLGAEVVRGNLDDRASLDAALQGAYGVFSVQPPGFDGTAFAPADEVRLGRNLADAAKAAGIRHFVYSSIGGAERDPGVPHFESKRAIELHIKALALPATILRPASFFELYLSPHVSFEGDVLSFIADPEIPVQHIAVQDIGAIAARAFDRFYHFVDQEIEIAGDGLTLPEIARAISTAAGRTIRYQQLPWDTIRVNPLLLSLLAFLRHKGFAADIPLVRALHPGLLTFKDWLASSAAARFRAALAA